MTENEAIEIIWERHMDCEDYRLQFDSYPDGYDFELDQAILIAAQALEEIQQYREIGTLEEFEKLKLAENGIIWGLIDEYVAYKQVGTVEECREAVEKQKPKKTSIVTNALLSGSTSYVCPNCGIEMMSIDRNRIQWGHMQKYCQCCGQAIGENLEGMEDE